MKAVIIFLLALGISTIFVPARTAEAKSTAYHQKGSNKWTNGKNTFYLKGSTLYKKTGGKKVAVLAQFAVTDAAIYYARYDLVTVYGNYAFVQTTVNDYDATVYSVNVKTGKKQKEAKIAAMSIGGKYMCAYRYNPTDAGAYPLYLYKIRNNKLKKIKMLGKHVFYPQVYNGRLYYASYSDSYMKKMTVYSCKVDGTAKKKLFSLKANGEYGTVYIGEVKGGKVNATVNEPDCSKRYQYSIKTKKLKKVS